MSASLRLLSYNAGGLPLVIPYAGRRVERLAAELAVQRYDIVALQEIWAPFYLRRLQRDAGCPVVVHRAEINGLVLLSRFEAVRIKFYRYSVRARPQDLLRGDLDAISRKGILAVRLKTPAGELDVFNTHMIASLSQSHTAHRVSQVLELDEAVRDFSSGNPFLLMGDFNFSPEDIEHELLLSLLGVEDPGLKGFTVCDRRVDYIFGRGIRTRRVFDQPFPIAGKRILLSDHLSGVEGILSAPFTAVVPGPGRRRSLDRAAAILMSAAGKLREDAGWIFGRWNRDQAGRFERVRARVES